mmetsp:Transcript_24182/g.52968  ORF Transcript_24182/g.52968 Transcript_24182/m.52968 type:complete len:231 (+) Transcript_24182:162-854(+)
MIWKYHGGNICSDGCIYAVPQSAWHVLKIDPQTDKCSLVGPELPGKYKWYGGVESGGSIYCVPQNSAHVLVINPTAITLHGDYGEGGHKWHGAAKSDYGTIVCIPNNVETVLLVTPGEGDGDAPTLTEIGDKSFIQTGRHRSDGKYKYLGAMYAIPLSGETLLRIDCSNDKDAGGDGDVEVTTWSLPSPFETLDKLEGSVICANGLVYTMPNNCKAVLKIQPCNWKPNND